MSWKTAQGTRTYFFFSITPSSHMICIDFRIPTAKNLSLDLGSWAWLDEWKNKEWKRPSMGWNSFWNKYVFIFLSTCISTRIFFKISGYHKFPGKVIAKISALWMIHSLMTKPSKDNKKERSFEDQKTNEFWFIHHRGLTTRQEENPKLQRMSLKK